MATIQDIIKNRFTEKGYTDLVTKLRTSISFFNEGKTIYPINVQMLGFGKWIVEDENELMGRIIELAELTFTKIKINKIELDGKFNYNIEI